MSLRCRSASLIQPRCFGVAGQLLGVGFLGGEDGEVAGVGAEARAVLADVGVGAGALGGCAQAEPAGQPGFDRWGVFPFGAAGDVGEREAGAPGGHGAESLLGQVEGAFVFGADGGVEQLAVAQAHFGGDVPEQGHQCLQRHSGVHQGRGIGVPELVRGDVPEPGGLGRAVQFLAQRRSGTGGGRGG